MIETVKPIEILEGGRRSQSLPTGNRRPKVAELERRNEIVARTVSIVASVAVTCCAYAAFMWLLLALAGKL